MKLENLFTENDPNISGDTNIDGLGLRIIWSAHGYKIYNSYINSISNDVRNYTLNVLNHWVVRSLCSRDDIDLNTTVGKFNGNKNTRAFKQACILLLENIYTYTLVEASENKVPEISTSGVLGSGNAIRNWRKDKYNGLSLYLATGDKGQLLVRQFSLGVNGRYKAPLRNLKFFNDAFIYTKKEPGSAWYAVETDLVKNWPELRQLKELLVSCISELMAQAVKEPKILFTNINTKIKNLYVKNFTNSKVVGRYSRDFWLERTKLDNGVAGRVGKELEPFIKDSKDLDLKVLYDKVFSNTYDEKEKKIVSDIVSIEPFMEHLDLMFHLMCCSEVPNIKALEEKWEEFGRSVNSLPVIANTLKPNKKVLSASGLSRINKCITIARQPSIADQARALEEYHIGLMQQRGQQAWIKILKNGDIQKNIHALELPDIKLRYNGSWVNRYYIGSHLNFLKGLAPE